MQNKRWFFGRMLAAKGAKKVHAKQKTRYQREKFSVLYIGICFDLNLLILTKIKAAKKRGRQGLGKKLRIFM
ncbi:MAG: hypothetical protein FWD86_00995 [Firmicutes bacterium]|nr:hypothetical protein [Bacillota bacterium]